MKHLLLLGLLSMVLADQKRLTTKSLLADLYAGGDVHLIAAGLISTEMGEYSPTFDAQSNELYFMRRTPRKFDYTIYKSELGEKGWSSPEVVSFSGKDRDAGPYLSPDGNTLFFDSDRPSPAVAANSINLWYSKRIPDGWSTASLLYHPSKNGADEPEVGQGEFGPAVDGEGNLYFYSFRRPYRGGARYLASPPEYEEVVLDTRLPDPSWNTFVSYLYISRDGDLAIMEGKAPNRRDTDLYCSCKLNGGNWTTPQPITEVNTSAGEGGASLTTDGQYLIFTSDRPTSRSSAQYANLYVVEAQEIIKRCKD